MCKGQGNTGKDFSKIYQKEKHTPISLPIDIKSWNFYFSRKKAFFVDLFVRVSNEIAVTMYKKLGYTVYRTVLQYYSGDPDEDAYGELTGQHTFVYIYI